MQTRRIVLAAVLTAIAAGAKEAPSRPRARDLGLRIGRYEPGPLDAITDVVGVRVGHTTVTRGVARTGVTAILPHAGDVWTEKVAAAAFVMNGNGEVSGLSWVNEQGALEVPIVLSSTMNLPRAADAVLTWMMRDHPAIGVDDDVVLPVVGECDDSSIDDTRGRHLTEADVIAALDGAKGGAVAEGSVGAGTGMIAYEFKGGIGTASRVLPADEGGWRVGVLVNANLGRRQDLVVAGAPVGREIPLPAKEGSGKSIILVVATDAPLDSRQLGRIAKRAVLGLARTGATGRHGSGDFVIAFSTGTRIPHSPEKATRTTTVFADSHLNPIFEATAEAAEEAVLNALLRATPMTARDGEIVEPIPVDVLKRVLKKYGRL